jgi:hypothetical protein
MLLVSTESQIVSAAGRKSANLEILGRSRRALSFACALAISLHVGAAGADVTADVFITGLDVAADDVERLEDGEVLSFSGADYENTDRELAADSMVLVQTDLDVVHQALVEETTVLPGKLIIESAVIHDITDFDGVAFAPGDIAEVDRFLRLKPGKDYNFSEQEYSRLGARLAEYRDADETTRLAAASDAMRDILIGRYQEYRARGLEGVESYQRSKRKAVDVGHELQMTTDAFKAFEDEFPEFVKAAVAYPDGAECCEHYFRWLKVKIAKRPTFALAHSIVQRTDDFVLLNERHFYVGHSLNSAQITLAWVPYGDGTYLGLGVSANADILDSTLGKMLRPVGRKKAEEMVSDAMSEIRSDLQSMGQDR